MSESERERERDVGDRDDSLSCSEFRRDLGLVASGWVGEGERGKYSSDRVCVYIYILFACVSTYTVILVYLCMLLRYDSGRVNVRGRWSSMSAGVRAVEGDGGRVTVAGRKPVTKGSRGKLCCRRCSRVRRRCIYNNIMLYFIPYAYYLGYTSR